MWTLSFVSASIRTVQVVGSTKTLAIGMESGPGFIKPVTFLPSQFITKVTWWRSVDVGPQSPDQVPVNGWPCWANPGATIPRQIAAQANNSARFMSPRYNATCAPSARDSRPARKGPVAVLDYTHRTTSATRRDPGSVLRAVI